MSLSHGTVPHDNVINKMKLLSCQLALALHDTFAMLSSCVRLADGPASEDAPANSARVSKCNGAVNHEKSSQRWLANTDHRQLFTKK